MLPIKNYFSLKWCPGFFYLLASSVIGYNWYPRAIPGTLGHYQRSMYVAPPGAIKDRLCVKLRQWCRWRQTEDASEGGRLSGLSQLLMSGSSCVTQICAVRINSGVIIATCEWCTHIFQRPSIHVCIKNQELLHECCEVLCSSSCCAHCAVSSELSVYCCRCGSLMSKQS